MPTLRAIAIRSLLVGLALACMSLAPVLGAPKEFVEGFEEPLTSWHVGFDKSQAKLLSHRRHDHVHRPGGARSESLELDVGRQGAIVQLQHALPPAQRIDDLVLSVWVRSNRPGAVLSMRIVFPHHVDPRTNKPLQIVVHGGAYTTPGKWQELKCTALDRQIQEHITLLRAGLRQPNIDPRGLYVDQAILTTRAESGTVELFIDDMTFGPIVTPVEAAPVVQAASENGETEPRSQLRHDRFSVDGRDFFMLMAAYHSEPLDELKREGFNAVWIPDYQDEQLLTELSKHGLGAIATPPRAIGADGRTATMRDVGFTPFSPKTSPILAWYVGTNIPVEALDELKGWCDQTQSADPMQRPIMADVAAEERIFSRHVPMLGASRHIVNTTLDFKQYREWLIQKQRLARPGSYFWTWIQTEPSSANSRWREAAGRVPIVIEPEQIRLQVYAAFCAGSRGIGYWKWRPMNDEYPGALERRLMISQLNLEAKLLEPFLATGKPFAHEPFTVETPAQQKVGQRRLDFRNTRAELEEGRALMRDDAIRARRDALKSKELEATVIRTNFGVLVLPVWYQQDAQYVPRKLAANNAKIKVEGVDETAAAWEVSTTHIRSCQSKAIPGGVEITLPFFDTTAAVIFTSNPQVINEIRDKIKQLSPESARVSVELAKAKLERTSLVNDELETLDHGQADAPQQLARARQTLQQAEAALARQSYHEAREMSGYVLQSLRSLQSAHWDEAVETFGSPIASPYTVCFQTLPDHWRMIDRLGKSTYNVDSNLLRSGDFEDIDTMKLAKWEHAQNAVENVRADAELYPSAQQGRYCLRLIAVPQAGKDAPEAVTEAPVTVTTPPMPVRAGQIIHISGWVKVSTSITGNPNGAILYDSLLGTVGALRWYEATDRWERFVAVREVQRSGEFTITMSLTGLGVVQFDDLRAVPHNPAPEAIADRDQTKSAAPPSRLRFWDRLPGFRPRREGANAPAGSQENNEAPPSATGKAPEEKPANEPPPPNRAAGTLPRILPRLR
ncbi:MAG: hypothetical protein WD648_01345 [Planctomycetaceae bacterium]